MTVLYMVYNPQQTCEAGARMVVQMRLSGSSIVLILFRHSLMIHANTSTNSQSSSLKQFYNEIRGDWCADFGTTVFGDSRSVVSI